MKRASHAGNAYVFAVCGSRKFTEELSYALRALRRVSNTRIIVVTDSTRNEQRIDWQDMLDVATPDGFDAHQASIYLKTSLHRLLPTGPRYCYLDADIVALRPEVDDIFVESFGLIAFAIDHSSLGEFSPYALHCGCLERHLRDLIELESMLAALAIRPSRCKRLLARIPYMDFELKRVSQRLAQWTHNPGSLRWTSPDGHEVHTLRCNHLVEHIHRQFGIHVNDASWQHWNGGVFLFDSSSHQFLDAWHRKTIGIFSDPMWRTRDQGTLAATVWEFGLQHSRVLGKEFNFIVDYPRTGSLVISSDGSQIMEDTSSAYTSPSLIHVLRHFGDTTWDIWNWLDKQVENNGITRS